MKALKKILVVDDDPVIGKSFDRVLTPKGYAVITAASGAEALARLVKEEYDAVYTDIKMPGMDGLNLARHLKKIQPWLPVVIVTGYGSQQNEAAAKEIGVSAFLRKPLSPEMIEESASGIAVPSTAEVTPAAAPAPAVPAAAPRSKLTRFALNVALFFAAPFIGLAYVVALPFVGIGALAWQGYRALKEKKT
jgi:CheY-like chemotaxis protein